MANLDSEDKRRSATPMVGMFTVAPVADGTIGAQDRIHAAFWYSGIAVGVGVEEEKGRPGGLLTLGVGC